MRHRKHGGQGRTRGETEIGERDARTRARRHSVAKILAAGIALLLLGVMASSALADGDPFSALGALTSSTGTTTSSDTTGASTDAATTTDATTTDAGTTTDAMTTD